MGRTMLLAENRPSAPAFLVALVSALHSLTICLLRNVITGQQGWRFEIGCVGSH
jgi:hypothetical protein